MSYDRGTAPQQQAVPFSLSEELMSNRIACALGLILIAILLPGCGSARLTPAVSVPPTATLSPPPLPSPSAERTATPSPTPTLLPTPTPVPVLAATPSAPLLATIEAIEEEVEGLRGLEEGTPIPCSLMTREQLAAYMERELAKNYSPEQVAADVRVLAAFDFVPQDFDLLGLLVDLYSTQVIGLYDNEQNILYVITDDSDRLNLLGKVTVAHEYVHSLQDQHFGLDDFVDEDRFNDDETMAHLSLVEGDASLAMTRYLYVHLDEMTDQDLQALQATGGEASQEVLDAAPPVIRETFMFPYIYGLSFVITLQEQGWSAVDAAYANPPRSTEQILHPEKYASGDEPQIVTLPPLTDTLGTDWHLVEAETLGEFQINLYLAQRVDQKTADRASQGWDGDRYALYAQDGAEVLVFATLWDSPADCEEFVMAYRQYAEGKYGRPPTGGDQAEAWWETATQTAVLTWEDTAALLILGPDRLTVEKVLAAVRLKW